MFRIGVSVKQQFTEEEIYKDRDSQISAIEKTFEDAQKSVNRHYGVIHLSILCCCVGAALAVENCQLTVSNWHIKPKPMFVTLNSRFTFRSPSTTVNPESHQWRSYLCSLTLR